MTPFEKIQREIAPELQRLNDRIASSLSSDNALMNRVISGYLSSKGKMIRPMLVILSARIFGPVDDKVLAAAAAVEMLHNASLIHDDVVDESRLRRGLPTVNAIWDNHIAVLTGDFFVSSSLLQALDTADIRIIGSLGRLGRLLSLGEIDQICNAQYHNLDIDAYYGVISRKTASLFVTCVEMGAYAASAPEAKIEPLRRVAELTGRAFQIRDDIFDYYADPAVGKPTGNDLREGKLTLPLLHVLNNESLPGCEAMRALAMKEQLEPDDIQALLAYAIEEGGIDYAYRVMEEMRDEAAAVLAEAFAGQEAAGRLLDVFDYIIARDH